MPLTYIPDSQQMVLPISTATEINIANCNLSGNLVVLPQTSMTSFTASNNNFKSITLKGCDAMVSANVADNPRLDNFADSEEFDILEDLDGSGCNFDSFPDDLGKASNTVIDLSDNPITSAFDLSACVALVTLNLSGCALPLAVQKAIVADLIEANNADGLLLDMSGDTNAAADTALQEAAEALVVVGWVAVELNGYSAPA